jgi:hypothetical protein
VVEGDAPTDDPAANTRVYSVIWLALASVKSLSITRPVESWIWPFWT